MKPLEPEKPPELRMDMWGPIIHSASPPMLRGQIDLDATAALWIARPQHSVMANRPKPHGIPLFVRLDGEIVGEDYERRGVADFQIIESNGTAEFSHRLSLDGRPSTPAPKRDTEAEFDARVLKIMREMAGLR